jgi:hypothetical protein
MKISYRLSDVHAAGNTTITLGQTHVAVPSASAEQLAVAWDRPLAEIRARLLRLGPDPTIAGVEHFGRWLMAKGMTPTAKHRIHGTK